MSSLIFTPCRLNVIYVLYNGAEVWNSMEVSLFSLVENTVKLEGNQSIWGGNYEKLNNKD
jgi:hypothetical protein